MSIWDLLAPQQNQEHWGKTRLVPAQPTDTISGAIWLGADLGYVEFSGVTPRAGDLVLILGQPGRRLCMLNSPLEPMRTPTFSSGCVCRCPPEGGVVFYLAYPGRVANALVLDASTGALLQVVGQQELGYGVSLIGTYDAAIAVDPVAPNNLYILDDRRGFATRRSDSNPTSRRGYFGLATYVISAGHYVFSSFTQLTDPYPAPGPHDPLNPAVESDPPAIPTNCLGVVNGIPLITMKNAPARYLAVSGATVTTHTLTSGGVNSSLQLRGNIVTVKDSPAQKSNYYCIAFDGANYMLVQFASATDTITKTINLPYIAPAIPVALASVCNRLIVLNSSTPTLGAGPLS